MKSGPVILWVRRELRLDDNLALAAAVASGRPVLPLYVLDETTPGAWAPGRASRWWLHHSLGCLAADLARAGAPLLLRRGAIAEVLPSVVREVGAVAIHAGRPIEPWARRAVAAVRRTGGVALILHDTTTLLEPGSVRNGKGEPYGVFSPFARACRAHGVPPPIAAPLRIPAAAAPASEALAAWGLAELDLDGAAWTPGEAGGRARLQRFRLAALAGYATARDRPDQDGTSMLSPHLSFGELSPRRLWHETAHESRFADELLWREFSAHLLWHHPTLLEEPLRPAFARIGWRDDAAAEAAWQEGRTGVPIVDAGLRQLRQAGWMHNRVRMIAASVLVKHLLIPWQRGEAWFWEWLVDADLASNAASWQWVAGCGADAAPWFRIFNPVLQGRKFDPDGAYVRRFVPELAGLPARWIHAPWTAPRSVLAAAGCRIGETYPAPIVDLAAGRARALAAFAGLGRGR